MKKREETEAQAKRVAALREYARLSRFKFDNGYPGYSAPTWFVDHENVTNAGVLWDPVRLLGATSDAFADDRGTTMCSPKSLFDAWDG
ncbi:MAG: hypothetical protein WA970_12445 [Gammaproteobacteria bacterium]